jgi:putative oxidoreductase
MNLLHRLEHWGDRHHPLWLDFVRIALGIFLCFKGFEFLQNMSSLMSLVNESVSFGTFSLMLLGHYIVFAHIVGGFLLVLGILTRFACIIQIPILMGAVVFLSNQIMQPYSQLLITLLVLILLIVFLIVGNGRITANSIFDRDK